MNVTALKRNCATAAVCGIIMAGAGCTGQTDNSFRLLPAVDEFTATQQVNTKVDLLWVVDNSASMDIEQDRLRNGFRSFAQRYLQPTWDIRVAVITTDTYLANPAFTGYLNSVIPGTTGWKSPYIASRLSTFQNPASDPNLVNLSTGTFPQGIRNKDQVPSWGPNYARLLPGIHDGPVAALCSEAHSYFFYGESQCKIRDNQTLYSGPSHCLAPSSSESAITQCVNTVENDSIHSGRPILSSQPPAGVAGDAAWTSGLVDDFMIDASTGTSGSGSERGLGSVLQLLSDNEKTDTAFFRPGSIRVLVFLTDEDDQTMQLPGTPSSGFGPYSNYTSNCPSKTVDGDTYTISSCPVSSLLEPVDEIKTQLDTFFENLDHTTSDPNYVVIPIVALNGASIQQLQSSRNADDIAANGTTNIAVDRGDRYLQLSSLVGGGSFAEDLAQTDYSSLLDHIGQAIVSRTGTFTLSRAPDDLADITVTILHADGSSDLVSSSEYSVTGHVLTLTDQELVLSLKSTDRIQIAYIPKNVL